MALAAKSVSLVSTPIVSRADAANVYIRISPLQYKPDKEVKRRTLFMPNSLMLSANERTFICCIALPRSRPCDRAIGCT